MAMRMNLHEERKEYEEPLLETAARGHAYEHYKGSLHVYAMELETKKVWDFSREDYVQRLVQNELDGKLVDLGEADSQRNMLGSTGKNFEVDSVFRFNKKLETLNHEYNTILL